MDEETQKIIAEQLKHLPQDVREAIVSVDYQTKFQQITVRQKLLIDQAAKLDKETTLVMIGLVPLANYVKNIQEALDTNETRAKEIALDISSNIFKPIRESLQAMNMKMEEEEAVINQPTNLVDEQEVVKFTNTNETSLNRDQILREIENPSLIGQENQTTLEIRPKQEIETVPGQTVKNIFPDIVTAKMTTPTMVNVQITTATPEIKLPVIEKRKPSDGIDPYREQIS